MAANNRPKFQLGVGVLMPYSAVHRDLVHILPCGPNIYTQFCVCVYFETAFLCVTILAIYSRSYFVDQAVFEFIDLPAFDSWDERHMPPPPCFLFSFFQCILFLKMAWVLFPSPVVRCSQLSVTPTLGPRISWAPQTSVLGAHAKTDKNTYGLK